MVIGRVYGIEVEFHQENCGFLYVGQVSVSWVHLYGQEVEFLHLQSLSWTVDSRYM
jgi:hypothetical protein